MTAFDAATRCELQRERINLADSESDPANRKISLAVEPFLDNFLSQK